MSNTEARRLIADQLDANRAELEKIDKRIDSLNRSIRKATARHAKLTQEGEGLAQALETLGGRPEPEEQE